MDTGIRTVCRVFGMLGHLLIKDLCICNRRPLPGRTQGWATYGADCACSMRFLCYFILRCYPCLSEGSMVCLSVVLSPAELTLKQHLEQMLNGSDGVSEQHRPVWG